MTADEWLNGKGKAPFLGAGSWNWTTDNPSPCYSPPTPEDADMVLPHAIFSNLKGEVTYPMVKCFRSKEEAINEFKKAFDRSVAEGFEPAKEP